MATPTTLSATQLLRTRHKEIEDLFTKTLDAQGDQRSELFDCLRATLAVHETTEEIFIHPLARRAGKEGERVVEARLAEEKEATKVLAELEHLGPDGDQFGTRLTSFRRAVIDHAEKEESELFPLLERTCNEREMNDLAEAIMTGETLAPTHAHPHAGQNPLALAVAGPFVAMVDKARDHFKQWSQDRSKPN